MPRIDDLLKTMVQCKASDLHLTSTFKPYIRQNGDMVSLDDAPVVSREVNRDMLYEIMPPRAKEDYEERWDADFAYEVQDIGRFRVNVFTDRFGIGAVLRTIPTTPPTADELDLPKAVRDFCYLPKGFVVVTGATGSGKSTTLAAMIDLINKTRSDHIVTIEDPIEFIHTPQRCLINQREVHSHTKSFANALRAALREDPDIVLVGEMRDLETMEIAIETAETGHLVFGTLHTNTAATTVNRIIDKFPANRQNQIRTMLADSLKGVVAQTLCKRKTNGRVAAMEILVATTGIASNIREGKTHHIASAMQVGRNVGMQMFNDSLFELVSGGIITANEAYKKSVDRESLLPKLTQAGFEVSLTDVEAAEAQPHPRKAVVREIEEFIANYRQVLQREPNNIEALNNLAWTLATYVDPRIRNAADAVDSAEHAYSVSKGTNPAVLDTLGAAYAEAGMFAKALDTAKKGLAIAEAGGQSELAKALAERIRLYESGKPIRDAGARNP